MTDNDAIDLPEDTLAIERPTFLTVLCIITFIVSGWNFIKALIALFSDNTYDAAQWQDVSEQLEQAMGGADENSRRIMGDMMNAMASTMQSSMEHALSLGVVELVASGLSILGAVFMFRLKLAGFYTYVSAKVIGIILPLALLGINMMTGLIYAFVAIVSAIFIVLYAVNRKYMR